jgi:uncharacterized protein (TIGR02588 family)
MAGKSKEQERDTRPGAATSKWEWVAGGVGLALVLGAVGFIAYNALTAEPSVPAVTVEHVGTQRNAGGYVVEFRARNSGPSTAASLTISGTLYDGSTGIETSQVTLDYLPPRGERRGGLIFQTDPAGHELKLKAQGYVDP